MELGMNLRANVGAAMLAVLCAGAAAKAQVAVGWFTIAGGSGTSSGGSLVVSGSIGQPDAGAVMSGGVLTVTGGFWAGSGEISGCGSADFNCDGDVGTDEDIRAFFACLSGYCPPPPCGGRADFDGDGCVGTDADIEAFFRVLSGGAC
jgi:hypothetical protein